MTVGFSLLIYLATFNILANVGSHMGPKVVTFNKILCFMLSIVARNRGIMSLFYYFNAETLRNIKFPLVK